MDKNNEHPNTKKSLPIRLQEQRDADCPDRFIPIILHGDDLYNVDLDRFFQHLPLDGLRSPHSLRAYGYDIVVWIRFLEQTRNTSIWRATSEDISAYHHARRRDDAGFRLSAASWNRCIAALDRLYRWALNEGLIDLLPFSYRDVWRPTNRGRRSKVIVHNDAYEGIAKNSNQHFITLDEFRQFRDVGLKGRLPDGRERPGARDRTGTRNALFAELLVSTGLRLEEASSLLASEIESLLSTNPSSSQVWFALPKGITKGNYGRSILVPRKLLASLQDYIRVERNNSISKFQSRNEWNSIQNAIHIRTPNVGAKNLERTNGITISLDRLMPEERGRLVICDANNTPISMAALWLTEVGVPVKANSWEAAFARASQRCCKNNIIISVSPHQLRHSFATHMLSMLIERYLKSSDTQRPSGAEGYRRLLGDPLQQVQRLLGHRSLETTQIYLEHLASRNTTVDAAVAELFGTITGEYGE